MSDFQKVLESLIEMEAPPVARRSERTAPALKEIRRRTVVPVVRIISDAERTIEFVASTESVDRYGDIVRVKGWETSNYMKNPVFLFGHNSSDPPIGKTVALTIEQNPKPALVQRVQFATKAAYPFADSIFQLYKGKFMRAVSVGFMPLEPPTPITDADGRMTGFEFTSQELLELSAVSIPANCDAVARAVEAGVIDRATVEKHFAERAELDSSEPATPKEIQVALVRARLWRARLSMAKCTLAMNELDAMRVEQALEQMLARLDGDEIVAPEPKKIGSLDDLFRSIAAGNARIH